MEVLLHTIVLLGLPALCSRLFQPSTSLPSSLFKPSGTEDKPLVKGDLTKRARWQATWRSFWHAVVLCIMLYRGMDVLVCARLVFYYVAIDFAAAVWEVDGNLAWDNWLHHGATGLLTGVFLVSDSYTDIVHDLGPSFLWLESTTILLNLYYLGKFFKWPSLVMRTLTLFFAAAFGMVRCLWFGYFFLSHVWLSTETWTAIPWLARLTATGLTLLQWLWMTLLLRKFWGSSPSTPDPKEA